MQQCSRRRSLRRDGAIAEPVWIATSVRHTPMTTVMSHPRHRSASTNGHHDLDMTTTTATTTAQPRGRPSPSLSRCRQLRRPRHDSHRRPRPRYGDYNGHSINVNDHYHSAMTRTALPSQRQQLPPPWHDPYRHLRPQPRQDDTTAPHHCHSKHAAPHR